MSDIECFEPSAGSSTSKLIDASLTRKPSAFADVVVHNRERAILRRGAKGVADEIVRDRMFGATSAGIGVEGPIARLRFFRWRTVGRSSQ